MPVSTEKIADEIVQHMRRSNCNVLTLRWSDFYLLCDRDRLRKGFMDALSQSLEQSSILLTQGTSIVAFVKDYDFAPYHRVHLDQ